MNPARRYRTSIAMLLYVCTLFSALTFGYHQSQMSAQATDGVDLVFCGSGEPAPTISLSDAHGQHSSSELQLTCPFCTLGHGSAVPALEWSVDYPPASPSAPIVEHSQRKPAPRNIWPSLNPRAPPVANRATVLIS